jgi:regulator of protease activity HflC (stomatin/prohibitin superfamily)
MSAALVIIAILVFLIVVFLFSAIKVAREYERGSSFGSDACCQSRRVPGSSS